MIITTPTWYMLFVLSVLRRNATSAIALKGLQRITATMATKRPHCQRLIGMEGSHHKVNDVVVAGRSVKTAKQHVFFFGGDVQDYEEKMHVCNSEYIEWNVEATAELLFRRFPEGMIMVVKPKTMYLNTFSIFSNFVDFSETSVPTHREDYGGLVHLVKLYSNILNRLQSGDHDPENSCDKYTCNPNVDIILIGFSKGCVVLNQFIYELNLADLEKNVKAFLEKVKSMYWLDGGHNGVSNTWITDRLLLKQLAAQNFEIYTHVTPYQVMDPMRAWLGQEQATFVKELKDLGANVKNFEHHFKEKPSIEKHFDVLKQF
ncbi:mitochondrial protein C2orf69 homolog [Ylistrum balloti]|uniref:mitochondrial protein C2orf69 homolog n=1 Tax=Ylistrum balloti TaxID=509963 RepID=UPI002905D17B|nr:mitochondrial protein C2orf69 homolog [Ylistrum balloti]